MVWRQHQLGFNRHRRKCHLLLVLPWPPAGYVVSDCNAVAALTWGHRTASNYAEAAAASVKAGVDMLCDKPELVSRDDLLDPCLSDNSQCSNLTISGPHLVPVFSPRECMRVIPRQCTQGNSRIGGICQLSTLCVWRHSLRPQVREAVAAGTLTEADLDVALTNTLRMRFLTGQFDPPSTNPWASLPVSTVNSREHRKLARQVVHKGG
jgi:beta-glucosidase-like glycosyl hydrolase